MALYHYCCYNRIISIAAVLKGYCSQRCKQFQVHGRESPLQLANYGVQSSDTQPTPLALDEPPGAAGLFKGRKGGRKRLSSLPVYYLTGFSRFQWIVTHC